MNLFVNTGVSVQYSSETVLISSWAHCLILPMSDSMCREPSDSREEIFQGCHQLQPGRLSNHCASWEVSQPGIWEKENSFRHQPSRGSSKQPDVYKTSNTVCAGTNRLERHRGQTVHLDGSDRSFTLFYDSSRHGRVLKDMDADSWEVPSLL